MYQRKSEFLYQLEMEKAFLIKTKTFKAIKEKTKNLTSKICKAKKEQFKRRIRDLEREGRLQAKEQDLFCWKSVYAIKTT